MLIKNTFDINPFELEEEMVNTEVDEEYEMWLLEELEGEYKQGSQSWDM